MSQQRKVYTTGDTENDDNLSTSGASEWDSTGLNGNVLAELKFKMAAFEHKVKQLKTEQEQEKLAAKMREKTLEKKLEGSEDKLKDLAKEMEALKLEYAKQKKDLEDAERHGQMAEIELVQKNMEEFAKQLVILEKKAEFGCEHEDSPLCKLVILAATDELEPALEKLAVSSGDSANSAGEDQLKFALDHLSALWTSLCKKTKRLCNPHGNRFNKHTSVAKILADGFVAKNTADGWQTAFAEKGFPIADELRRMNYFSGMVMFYYEITFLEQTSKDFSVGLAGGCANGTTWVGGYANSYAAYGNQNYRNYGTTVAYERPSGFIAPKLKGKGDVYGCGVLQSPQKKLFVFFTANGTLLGKQVAITPDRDYLYPAVSMHAVNTAVEANFGDNPSKPFKYNIVAGECPGLVFEQEQIKTNGLCNPQSNHWSKDNSSAKISLDYFVATNTAAGWQTAFSAKGFPIAEELRRMNYFSGMVIYYYEVTLVEQTSTHFSVGLVGGFANVSSSYYVGGYANSYAAYGNGTFHNCGNEVAYARPSGFIAPELKGKGDVYGCGVLQNSQKKLFVFFTANGTLLGKQVAITPDRDYLYPAVSMHGLNTAMEANFGNNPSKPFKYNIVAGECPGLVFE